MAFVEAKTPRRKGPQRRTIRQWYERKERMEFISKAEPGRKSRVWTILQRKERERFYISFSIGGTYDPVTQRWRKGAWPKLFKTRDLAEEAVALLPVFANKDAISGVRGRIKSVSIEKVLLPAVEPGRA